MASYLIINDQGEKTAEPLVIPTKLAAGQRISLLDYLTVGTHGARPNFTDNFGNCTLKVTSSRLGKTDQYLVKIEILGDNCEHVDRLHKLALQRIISVASDVRPPAPKKSWLDRLFGN